MMPDLPYYGGRGGLLVASYEYRFGILFWEVCFSIFLWFGFFYVLAILIYLFNVCRGKGWGDSENKIAPVNINNLGDRRKKAKRKDKYK
ncbi:hypothetical protein [Acinetobacter sp. NIPH 2699]|uniref:hypothetical protein n=1 Tax=Acinetobacter sp. NIPH 2699 TaxID=2923433 RepID=UPI001F4AC560|nr:hypothetical protein [Acinetobacter sp. NIPH 2699]MCH7337359.1 hypothetical protein [Acinetobacter sp. NIPH 2699]